jgi:hypothetical protein
MNTQEKETVQNKTHSTISMYMHTEKGAKLEK